MPGSSLVFVAAGLSPSRDLKQRDARHVSRKTPPLPAPILIFYQANILLSSACLNIRFLSNLYCIL